MNIYFVWSSTDSLSGFFLCFRQVQEFGSLDNILENTSSIKQNARRAKLEQFADQALLSRTLVDLDSNVPLDMMTMDGERIPFEKAGDLRADEIDEDRVVDFYDKLQFKETKRRFLNALNRGNRPNRPRRKSSRSRPKSTPPEADDFSEVPF